MKNLRPLLLVLIAGVLQAQNKNYATHQAIDEAQDMVAIHNKSYYAQIITQDCCQDVLVLKCSNAAFQDSWSVPLMSMTSNRLNKLLVTRDKHLLLLVHSYICDVLYNQNFLAKVDTLGNVVFQTTVQPGGAYSDIAEYADSSFYMVSGSQLHHYSKSGQFIASVAAPLTNLRSVFALANGNLLIGSLQFLQEVTPAGVAVGLPVSGQSEKMAQTTQGNVLSLSAGQLSVYNATLGLLATSNGTLGANQYITDFTLKADTLFVTGYNLLASTPFYARLSSNLVLLQPVASTTYAGIRPTGIAVTRHNKVRILAGCYSNANSAYTFSGLYEMGPTGNFNSVSNIGVSGATVNAVSYVNSASRLLCLVQNMDVRVSNYGADTIKSFYLNHYFKDFLCTVLLHKLCNVTILPGQSATVPTGTFYAGTVPTNSLGVPTASNAAINVCVFTTIPNNSNDININNDGFCQQVSLGLADQTQPDLKLLVYPNPAGNSLHVTCEAAIRAYRVYNAIGQLQLEAVNNSVSGTLHADIGGLAPGIYTVSFETERGAVQRRILKE